MSEARFFVGDVFEQMAKLPDQSVDLVLTSPPFLALRSYLPVDHPDKGKEIGSEATPAAFLDTLLALTVEWRRILAPHGSICVELGDTYAGSGGSGGDYDEGGLREAQPKFRAGTPRWDGRPVGQTRTTTSDPVTYPPRGASGWPLDKSLCFIPSLYGASLAYGRNLLNPGHIIEPWRVRNLIAWCRPNPPVGALGDKVRPATSYLTVACTGRKRWFDLDAVRTEHKTPPEKYSGNGYTKGSPQGIEGNEAMPGNPSGAPPLDWWSIPTEPYPGSHYATWPRDLCVKPIKMMCPEKVCRTCGKPSERITETETVYGKNGKGSTEQRANSAHAPIGTDNARRAIVTTLGWTDCGHDDWRRGVVLDPFGGTGTTGAVATGLGRDAILIDIDERNAELAQQRIGMFLNVQDAR